MAFVQEVASGANASNSATLVLTLSGITTTAGNHLILGCGTNYACTLNSVADSRGNTWQVDKVATDVAPNDKSSVAIASCKIAAGKALVNGDTITLTFSSSIRHGARVWEFSGLATTSWVSQVAGSAIKTSQTASDTGATGTTDANVLLFAVTGIQNGSGPTGFAAEVLSPTWNLLNAIVNDAGYPFVSRPMYRVGSAAAAYSAKASWTSSYYHAEAIVAYKQSAESHSGSATLTGAGVVTEVGRKAASTSVTATGAGVATLARTSARTKAAVLTGAGSAVAAGAKGARSAQILTGAGAATTAQSTARSRAATLTGAGAVTIHAAAAEFHTGAVTLTGAGVAAVAARKGALSAPAVTGAGVLAVAVTTERSTAATFTGAGVATITATAAATSEDHYGAAVLTGSGSATVAVQTGRGSAVTATGVGEVTASIVSARLGAALLSGGGVLTDAHSTARAGAATATGAGIATVDGLAAATSWIGIGKGPSIEVRSGVPSLSVQPVAPTLAVRNPAPVVSVWASAPEIAVRVVRPQITEVR
jgi:hypothetical protein